MTTATSITVRVPLTIRRRPGRKMVVTPVRDGVPAITTCADPALVKALARAFRYQRLLDDGRYASISEMAAGERIERGYLGSVLRLTLLAPSLVEAILDGRHGGEVTLPALLNPGPLEWQSQQAQYGCEQTPARSAPVLGQPGMNISTISKTCRRRILASDA